MPSPRSHARARPARKLYQRFLRRLLPLLALAFAVAVGLTAWVSHAQQRSDAQAQRQQILAVFGHALVKPLWDCDGTTVQGIAHTLTQQPAVVGVQVYNSCQGAMVYAGQALTQQPLDVLQTPLVYTDEQNRGHEVGTLALGFTPPSLLRSAARSLWLQLIIFGSMLAVVLASAAWAFERIIGRPLHALRQAMRQHTELTPIPARWAEEMAEVAHSYNLQVLALRRQALHDPLTGLGNRMLLQEHLQPAVAQALRCGSSGYVLLLDLNRFKPVNDTYGHAAGDAVLQTVAQRLLHCVREADTVIRLGGDEFVLLISHCPTPEELAALCDRIRRSLAEPITWQGQTLHISTSIGCAQFPRDGTHSDALLAHADQAMYGDKGQGRER